MNTQEILATVDRAYGAVARGDSATAETQFLVAARGLLNLARTSHGELRDTRTEQARRLMEQARNLAVRAEAPLKLAAPSKGGKRPGPSASDDIEHGESDIVPLMPEGGFDDVVGMDDLKDRLYERFLFPIREPEKSARYLQHAAGGLLLYGPPGTGKTHLVRALAGEIDAPVYVINPARILSKWVGEAEQRLAAVFADARRHPRAVIFIDEINGLTPPRDGEQSESSKRLVDQLLGELDGFERNQGGQLIFIGATNFPDKIDPALRRPGRFDELVYLGPPDAATRAAVLADELGKVAWDETLDVDALVERTEGYSVADLKKLVRKAAAVPYAELIREGSERGLRQADIELALSQVRPSITAQMLAVYERFARDYGG